MTDATPAEPRERQLRLRYAGHCRDCGTLLAAGTRARWDSVNRTTRCLACPTTTALQEAHSAALSQLAVGHGNHTPNWGVAGTSAQRQFDEQQSRRRARIRARWVAVVLLSALGGTGGAILATVLHAQPMLFVVLGAVLPVLKLLATPQHIDAWRSGAAGERAVGARLDKLRSAGVLTLHDRRVPGRRTNIDHIAVSPGGVFVIDTKNVAGKVSPTRNGLRVAGRRRDEMVTGVQGQIEVVRQTIADQHLSPDAIRGVLCFTRAELPWLRRAPGGIALLNPRGLARTLRKPGRLSREQVHHLATVLAQRLPFA
jgi:hypothetical protein